MWLNVRQQPQFVRRMRGNVDVEAPEPTARAARISRRMGLPDGGSAAARRGSQNHEQAHQAYGPDQPLAELFALHVERHAQADESDRRRLCRFVAALASSVSPRGPTPGQRTGNRRDEFDVSLAVDDDLLRGKSGPCESAMRGRKRGQSAFRWTGAKRRSASTCCMSNTATYATSGSAPMLSSICSREVRSDV